MEKAVSWSHLSHVLLSGMHSVSSALRSVHLSPELHTSFLPAVPRSRLCALWLTLRPFSDTQEPTRLTPAPASCCSHRWQQPASAYFSKMLGAWTAIANNSSLTLASPFCITYPAPSPLFPGSTPLKNSLHPDSCLRLYFHAAPSQGIQLDKISHSGLFLFPSCKPFNYLSFYYMLFPQNFCFSINWKELRQVSDHSQASFPPQYNGNNHTSLPISLLSYETALGSWCLQCLQRDQIHQN